MMRARTARSRSSFAAVAAGGRGLQPLSHQHMRIPRACDWRSLPSIGSRTGDGRSREGRGSHHRLRRLGLSSSAERRRCSARLTSRRPIRQAVRFRFELIGELRSSRIDRLYAVARDRCWETSFCLPTRLLASAPTRPAPRGTRDDRFTLRRRHAADELGAQAPRQAQLVSTRVADEFLTVAEVADALKVAGQTVRNWIDRGE